jgi:hypothetical protein
MGERKLFRESDPHNLEASEMTDAERQLHRTVQDAKLNVDALRAQLNEAEKIFNQYRASCDHGLVFYVNQVPYTIRFCGICDSTLSWKPSDSAIL